MQIEVEFRGAHEPETVGAEWLRFAGLCRKLASELRGNVGG